MRVILMVIRGTRITDETVPVERAGAVTNEVHLTNRTTITVMETDVIGMDMAIVMHVVF